MRTLIIAAGTLALGISGAAVAKPGNGHGKGHGNPHAGHAMHGPGHVNGCPPGLAKKGNGCLPPGQARKAMWSQGYRVPVSYSRWSSYNSIPSRYRSYVPYNANYRYVYNDNYVYAVDPKTRLVQTVIDLLNR
jgi:hypothetical protein